MQSVEAAELMTTSQIDRRLDQVLVDLDPPECRPLDLKGADGGSVCDQANGSRALDEGGSTCEPAIRPAHRLPHEVAAVLGDVPLDQGAGV